MDIERDFQQVADSLHVTSPTLVSPLPDAVQKFCQSIDKNFEGTALRLFEMAEHLHNIAKDLEDRARQLRDAAPDLSEQLERWVSFERESNELEKFYRPLIK